VVPKCPRHFGTAVSDFFGGAEVSVDTGAEVANAHFGTSAEMSWLRSVLGPKYPYTVCKL